MGLLWQTVRTALRGTQVRNRVQYVAQIDLAGQLIGGLSQQWMQKRMGCLGSYGLCIAALPH